MQIRFIGATDGHVTGSCTQFKYDRKNIQFLVDCGLVQGEGDEQLVNAKPFPFAPSEIKFVLLTHAHQDHCGLIPKLYREGFQGKVICTAATAKLAKLSLLDSVKFANNLYSEKDIENIQFEMIDKRPTFGLSRMIPIADDLFVSFSRTAHILGAVSITIGWLNENDQKMSIVMSGDLGNNTKDNPYQPLLAGRQSIFGYPDAIVVESTYGGRVREKEYSDFDLRMQRLRKIIQEVVFDRKEILIIPAFALHRTQELLVDVFYVMKHFFADDEECLSPFYASRMLDEELKNNSWNHLINRCLNNAIETLDLTIQSQWSESICTTSNDDVKTFSLSDDSKFSIEDVKSLLMSQGHVYPVDIVLDGSLASKMSNVYREELGRRQIKEPTETLYRNRKLAERLNALGEDGVDEVINSLFPNDTNEVREFSVGRHQIQYRSNTKITRKAVIQDRGFILITGGGMCDSGPIVKHLTDILTANREAVLLTTGYMPSGSVGANLVAHYKNYSLGVEAPSEPLKINNEQFDFEGKFLEVRGFNDFYSGHADQTGLLDFIFQIVGKEKTINDRKPATVILNHGQHSSRNTLKAVIEERACKNLDDDRPIKSVELSRQSECWFDLNTKEWFLPEKLSTTDALLRDILLEQRKTNLLLSALIDAKPKSQSLVKNKRN